MCGLRTAYNSLVLPRMPQNPVSTLELTWRESDTIRVCLQLSWKTESSKLFCKIFVFSRILPWFFLSSFHRTGRFVMFGYVHLVPLVHVLLLVNDFSIEFFVAFTYFSLLSDFIFFEVIWFFFDIFSQRHIWYQHMFCLVSNLIEFFVSCRPYKCAYRFSFQMWF